VLDLIVDQIPNQPMDICLQVHRLGIGARLHQLLSDIGHFFAIPPVISEGAAVQSISPDEAEAMVYPELSFRVRLMELVIFHQSLRPKCIENIVTNPCMHLLISSFDTTGDSHPTKGIEASFRMREASLLVSKGIPSASWYRERLYISSVAQVRATVLQYCICVVFYCLSLTNNHIAVAGRAGFCKSC
jgi:hypothetical protein